MPWTTFAAPPSVEEFNACPRPPDATVAKMLIALLPGFFWIDSGGGGIIRQRVLEFEAANPGMFIGDVHLAVFCGYPWAGYHPILMVLPGKIPWAPWQKGAHGKTITINNNKY